MNDRSQVIESRAGRAAFTVLAVLRRLVSDPYRVWTRRLIWGAFMVAAGVVVARSVPYYAYFDMGVSAFARGDFFKAEDLLARAEAETHRFGSPDRRFKNCTLVLANLYANECKYDEAERYYGAVIHYHQHKHGAESKEIAQALEDIAFIRMREERLDEAGPLLEQSIAMREKVEGADAPQEGVALHALAQVRARQGKNQEAEQYYERAIGLFQKGGKHFQTQLKACCFDYSRLAGKEGKQQKAAQLASKCNAIEVLPPRDLERQIMHLAFLVANQLFDCDARTYENSVTELEENEATPSVVAWLHREGWLPQSKEALFKQLDELDNLKEKRPVSIFYAREDRPDAQGYIPVEIAGRLRARNNHQSSSPFILKLRLGINPSCLRPVVASIEVRGRRPRYRSANL